MKKQKPSRLFRALLCSSIAGLASQSAIGEDGVARVGYQPPPEPNGQGGIAPGSQDGTAVVVPDYALPQFVPPAQANPLVRPQQGIWQDQLGPRARLETRIGEWLGSEDNGDFSINAMVPFWTGSQNTVFFVDGRGTTAFGGGVAASLAGGFRTYDPSRNRILGISGGVDHDSGNARDFTQANLSIESLGRWFDFRANGYYVFSDETAILNTTFTNAMPGGPTGVMVDRVDRVLSAFSGASAEIGGPAPILGRYGFETHVGGYYYGTSDDEHAAGVSVRVNAHVTDDLQLRLNVTNDNLFDTEAFGMVVLTLPDGRPQEFFRPRDVRRRMLSRVERRYRVTTHERTKVTQVPGAGGMMMMMGGMGMPNVAQFSRIVYVDPERATNGDGTFDNQLNTFVGFTNTGGGNTLFLVNDGNLTGPLTLQNNDVAVSVQYTNTTALMIQTPAGAITVPSLDPNAGDTIWSNPTGGQIISIAGNNTEVAGFTFDGTTNAGIPNNDIIVGSNIQGFHIHDNTFRNYRNAIQLTNATGTIAAGNPGLIYSNNFYGQTGTSFNALDITNNGLGQLDLELGSTEHNLRVSMGTAVGNVAIGNSGEDANGNGLLDAGEDTNGNGVLDSGSGFSVTALNRAIINARVFGNRTGIEDANRNGVLDSEDTNNNGQLDIGEDLNGNGLLDGPEDLNGNGVLDPSEDVDGNGNLDPGEDTNNNGILDPAEDVNMNGILDVGEDVNGDGFLEPSEDLNGNGILDFGEDLNQNGIADLGNGTGFAFTAGATQSVINLSMVGNTIDGNIGEGVQIVANSSTFNAGTLGEDVNGNGLLDGFEDVNRDGIFERSEDLNFNNQLDMGEDVNNNGILDRNDDLNNNGFMNFGEDGNEDTNGNGFLDTTGTSNEDINSDGFLNLGNQNGQLDGGFLITGNTFTNNGGDGFNVDSTNNSNVLLIMTANTFGDPTDRSRGNRGLGVNVNANSGTLTAQLGFLNNEDANLNGVLDAGEDLNNNRRLDLPLNAHANRFVANVGGGASFNLTGSAIGRVDAANNIIVGTGGGVLNFAIDGDTSIAPMQFINGSPIGMDITRIVWNIGTAGLEFNTEPAPNGQPLLLNNGTDVDTGLQTVNGNGQPFVLPDLSTTMDLVFNDFNPINGVLDMGEDTNANGVLDPAEDVNMNGIIDMGEDLNMNGVLDPSEDLPELLDFTAGIVAPGSTVPAFGNQLIGSTVTATFSTGQVVSGTMQADPNSLLGAVFVPAVSNVGSGTGFAINVSDTARLQASTIQNNNITDYGGPGLSVQASGMGVIDNVDVRLNVIDNNGSSNGVSGFESGVRLRSLDSAQLTARVIDNGINNNPGGGIDAVVDMGTMVLTQIESNTLDGNGRGVSLAALQNGSLEARITDNEIMNSVDVAMSGGDAIRVLSDNSTVKLNEVAGNRAANNAGTGLHLITRNNGTIDVCPTEDFNGNGILDPGEDANEDVNMNGVLDAGEDVNGDGFLNLGNGNGLLDRGIINNVLSNNGGGGLLIDSNTGGVSLGNVVQNQVVNNVMGTGGILLNGFNASLSGTFTGNTISGDPANNMATGPGFLVSTRGGDFNVTFGGSDIADRNVVQMVAGTGIGVQISDSGTGQFVIQNNLVTNVSDDNDPLTRFSGDAVSVSLVGSDAITPSTARLLRSSIEDNVLGADLAEVGMDGSGVAVLAGENTRIEDLLIARNVIRNAGRDNTMAFAEDDAGIEFDRLDDAEFDIVNPRPGQIRAITIAGNDVQNNTAGGMSPVDGMDINVMNGIRDDIDFEIVDNVFSGNSGNGIHLNTQADASLATEITRNIIENNAFDGISMDGFENVIDDLETQGGTWSQNTIRNNGAHGIQINSVSGDVVPLIIGLNGTDPITGQSLGNLIEGNAMDGIEINGGGFSQINNNIIARNGEAGVDINGVAVGVRTDLLQNNSITQNALDGLEYNSAGVNVGTLIAFGNSIDNNLGRGVDILSQAGAVTNVRFGDGTLNNSNRIASNGLEGFYVVNTSSTAQNQTDDANVALDATGSVLTAPDLILDLQRNTIVANNNQGTFGGAGLVIRVGTSGASLSFTGADASGLSQTFNSVGTNAAGIADGNGRINARVTDNTFEGNLGEDVFIESFVSTVNPVATGGVWNAMVFAPTVYEGDPLARLNLKFTGNTGNSINVTRPGAFYDAPGEAAFKSKVVGNAPGGPFTSPTRIRNAQRLPSRDGLFTAPIVSPDGGIFEYAGVGESTFRVESDFDVNGFQAGDTFLLDGQPFVPGLNSAGIISGVLIGEEPWGWTSVTPGTFQFDEPFSGLFGIP